MFPSPSSSRPDPKRPTPEAADVVLLVDRLDRLLPGLEVAQRSRRIAIESVFAGIGLSIAGMVAAAFGYLTPVQGALLQELIDLAIALAQRFDAALIGAAAATFRPPPVDAFGGAVFVDVVADEREQIAAELRDAETRFRSHCASRTLGDGSSLRD